MALIVLIHGAWLTPLGFERMKARYEAAGHTVIAPPWPYEDKPIAELRARSDPRLKSLTIRTIVDHYDRIIRALPMPPVIIGHSFGGLFAQLLLDRGLGSVGVALDPAPIAGVLAGPRALLSALPVLTTIGGWNKVLSMSFKSFANTFGQTMPEADKRAFYDRHIIPTPGRIFYQAAFGREAGIDRRNPNRAPLLLVVADKDRTVTPGMVRSTYRKQRRAPSKTEFMSFPRRSHLLFAEPGFEEVADRVLAWALENRRSGATAGKR